MISFIIPTLNEEKVIERTLKCLKAYDGPHEVIVSDGGSHDRTVEIARKYADHVVVHTGKDRQRIGAGRNRGAEVAKGNFLVFWDADVMVPNPDDFFKRALKVFEDRPGTVAIFANIRVMKQYETVMDWIVFNCLNWVFFAYNNILHIGMAAGEFQMIRAGAFHNIHGYNEGLAASEDCEISQRLARHGHTRLETTLTVYHTGRRAHKIGWAKLLWQWNSNTVSMWFFKKSASKEWKEIR
jgi:glycosyltransferase involved in cell wall biosynthesis